VFTSVSLLLFAYSFNALQYLKIKPALEYNIIMGGANKFSKLSLKICENLKNWSNKPPNGSCKNIVLFLYSLVVIAELTLYFDESQNELAVGLTLTIMLVMYTMYQSINDSFVKTAYLKMIDYWLLFCLLTPLAIFLIEIFWLLNKTKESLKAEEKKWTSKDNKMKEMSNRRFIQILVPSLTVIFIVSYFAVAIGISAYLR
jgi:hypothetical protein